MNRLLSNTTDNEVRQEMLASAVDMLAIHEQDGLLWTGTTSDLVELSHLIWESGLAIGRDGLPMTFKTLVGSLCRSLHVECPKNPTAVMNNIRNRKRPNSALEERCRTLMTLYGEQHPIKTLISRNQDEKRKKIL